MQEIRMLAFVKQAYKAQKKEPANMPILFCVNEFLC